MFFSSTSKQIGFELVFKINQIVMFFSILCYLPSRHKKAGGFTPLCSTKAPQWIHHLAYSASIQTPTFIVGWFCNHFSQNITFKNSIFFWKQTLVKYIYCLDKFLLASLSELWDSSLNPLTKFTSSSRSTQLNDIFPWNISQMIKKIIPLSMRIHKLYNEMGHSILSLMGSWWKLRQQEIWISPWRESHCRTNTSIRQSNK